MLPATVPAHVTQTLYLCLRKDPKQRVGDIRDVCLALEGAFETAAAAGPARASIWPWVAAAAFATIAAVVLLVPKQSTPTVSELRFEMPSLGGNNRHFLSPDGQRVAIVRNGGSIFEARRETPARARRR